MEMAEFGFPKQNLIGEVIQMKKIGFVDYFIDEWHANNYIGWIREQCEIHGYEFEVAYAWAEVDTFQGSLPTDQWCAKNNVTKCDTLEELCEKSDNIIILSPSNPEKHLGYAKTVLKYGKNTYIDKTFAPNLEEAKEIFALGEQYGTKFFSTSALRYSAELDKYADGVNSAIVQGGGDSLDEYVIHQIEMLVKLMGVGAEKAMVFPSSTQRVCVVKYKDGRTGFLNFSTNADFGVDVEDLNGNTLPELVASPFFNTLLHTILTFFQDGELPFDPQQTLDVIAIRDAFLKGAETPETWISL